jgi:hypothetical protein
MAALAHVLICAYCGVVLYRLAPVVQKSLLLTGFTTGFLIIHGIVPLIASEVSSSIDYDEHSRDVAAWFSLACAVAFGIGVCLSKAPQNAGTHFRSVQCKACGIDGVPRGALAQLLVWSAALGVLGLILMARAETDSLALLLDSSRFEFRHSRATIPYLLGTYLTGFACAPPVISVGLALHWKLISVVYSLSYVYLSYFIFLRGARSLPLGILGSLLIALALHRRLGARALGALAVGTILIGTIAVGLYEARKRPRTVSETVAFLCTSDAYADALARDPLNYHQCTIGAIKCFPAVHPFLNLAVYRRVLFFFIPSSVSSFLKPPDPNVRFGEVVFNTPYQWNVTVPPSIPGEVWVNCWGWVGLLPMVFYGWMVRRVDDLLVQSPLWQIFIGSQSARLVLLGMRGQFYDLFVPMLFIILTGWLIMKLSRFGCRGSPKYRLVLSSNSDGQS